jgi:ethanolamine utilization microcompartment shell protein EutS
MEARLRNEKLPGTRARFNARSFALVALGILLCAGIAGCLEPPTPPSQFLLSSPAHLTTGVLLTPTLNWTDAVGETGYTVEIDDEDTFSSPLVHQNPGVAENTTSFVVPSGVLAGGTTYYWRVIATNSAGSTIPRNAPWIFTAWSTGPLVPEFGTGGAVTSNPSTDYDVARAIAIDSTAMYVVGSDGSPEGWNSQWRIEKRSLTDGSLVPEFGAAGVVTSNPSAGFDVACGMAIDSTAMYVVGYDRSPGNPQWRIEKRSLTDGSLVPGFGAAGVITSNPSAGSDVARGIAIDSTAVYVVGCDNSPGEWDLQWRVEKRSLTDGSLVSEFGTGGVVTSNNTTGHHPPQDIAIDSTAMYVVGSDNSLWWRIEKRSLTDGSLIPEFGTGGVVISNPSGWYDEAYDIAIDSAAMYVVGIYSTMGYYSYHNEWRVEKRSLTDGGLVAEFGAGGVATSNTTGGADVAHGIAIDSAAMYVVGFDSGYPGERWRIEKRSLADGGLVPEFGAGGVVTSDPSGYDDRAYGIAIDSTALYVVGYDRSPGDAQWRIEKRFR